MNALKPVLKHEVISLPNADITYFPSIFATGHADQLFLRLCENVNWTQRYLSMYGKKIRMPRMIAWYADPGVHYRYSGGESPQNEWTTELHQIKQQVENISYTKFNGALLNLYRTGQDSMSWHSDDERSLGTSPVIASVSFGATRRLSFKHRYNKKDRMSLSLEHGSVLIMRGSTQQYWQHCLPKTRQQVAARVNITYRALQRNRT